MSMRHRKKSRQSSLWIATEDLASAPGHPFYQRVNELLDSNEFDRFVEDECAAFYAEKKGRPSIPPGVYFRMLFIGYFERLHSERAIAWRCMDSLSLRSFLGFALDEKTPDHSWLSKTRNRFPIELHQAVFSRVLEILAENGLLQGKTIGVDATILEANAALRSMVKRDTGQEYNEFLEELAKESGIKTPTRQDLARIDRKRPGKGSNDDWFNPNDPDAQIMKMKDGRTKLSHKLEHGVDLDSGAIVGISLHGGACGDPSSITETVDEVKKNLNAVKEKVGPGVLHEACAKEIVADKGYHSNDTLLNLTAAGHRSYVSEPNWGRRRWRNKAEAREAVYANRRRIRGERGKELLRRRGELVERPFEHALNAGGMRRTFLRTHLKIYKRIVVHFAAMNIALVIRSLLGSGTPKQLAERLSRAKLFAQAFIFALIALLKAAKTKLRPISQTERLCSWMLLPRSETFAPSLTVG